MGFWENVKQFNERWNDLPRRGAIVLMVLLALLAGLLLTHRLPEAEAWLRGSFPGLNW